MTLPSAGYPELSGAQFSPCRMYRYSLWRVWKPGAGYAMFIGLNPSTADEVNNDPTVRRCIAYAKDWGYGGIHMLNIFAFRATDPKVMKLAADPIGPENNSYLEMYHKASGITVACWGNHGAYLRRGEMVAAMFDDLHCFGMTKQTQPKHPLYLKADLKPIRL